MAAPLKALQTYLRTQEKHTHRDGEYRQSYSRFIASADQLRVKRPDQTAPQDSGDNGDRVACRERDHTSQQIHDSQAYNILLDFARKN
jgi:phage anti-repressor protein